MVKIRRDQERLRNGYRLKEIKETSHLNVVCDPALNPGQEKKKGREGQGGKGGRQEKGREGKKEGWGEGEIQMAVRIWGQLNKFEYEHRLNQSVVLMFNL